MPVTQIEKAQLGGNIFVEVEHHPRTDIPCYFPQFTSSVGIDVLFLCNLRDKNYRPTPEERATLIKEIQSKKSWAYLRVLPERTRED